MNRLSAALVSASLLIGALSACNTPPKPSAPAREPLSQAEWTFVTQAHTVAPATTSWPDASTLNAGHAICAQARNPQMQTPYGPDLVRENAVTATTYHLDDRSATLLVLVALEFC